MSLFCQLASFNCKHTGANLFFYSYFHYDRPYIVTQSPTVTPHASFGDFVVPWEEELENNTKPHGLSVIFLETEKKRSESDCLRLAVKSQPTPSLRTLFTKQLDWQRHPIAGPITTGKPQDGPTRIRASSTPRPAKCGNTTHRDTTCDQAAHRDIAETTCGCPNAG